MNAARGDAALQLRALYPSDVDRLEFTSAGIWLATPLSVLVLATRQLCEWGAIRDGFAVLDAGAGDGRVLAAIALSAPERADVRLFGIECDEALALEARRICELIAPKTSVVVGDFSSNEPFDRLGIAFGDFDLVIHYPDGAERDLHRRFFAESRAGARLAFLSPQLAPLFEDAPARTARIDGGHAQWTLHLFER